MDEPIVELNGNSFAKKEGVSLVSQVTSYFDRIGGQANTAFGIVLLDKKGVKNDNAHPNYRNKTIAYEAIKDVLEKGTISLPFGYHSVHGKSQPTGRISGIISIDGILFRCDVTVIGNLNGTIRLYLHDVYQIEEPQQNTITKHVLDSENPLTTSRHSVEDNAKIQQKTETNNNNSIKTENYMRNNKRTIRLTESDIHRMIKRAVYEATKGERGMSDKQKQRRRNADYIKDVNGSGDKYFHPNTYSDYEPSNIDRYERNAPFNGSDWFDDKVHTDRMKKHRSSQNHKDPDDFMESIVHESVKRLLREDHDNGRFVSWAIDKLSSCEAVMSLLEYDFATLRIEVYANEHSGEVADRIMASSIDEARDFIQKYQGRPMEAFLDFEVTCANVLDLVH